LAPIDGKTERIKSIAGCVQDFNPGRHWVFSRSLSSGSRVVKAMLVAPAPAR